MRRRKFWLTILLLSSMASMQILAQGLTPPSGKAPLPASPQDSPLYTEAQVIQALRVGIQVALDKAVPLAVQAAVAEKEGQRATAQSLADQWDRVRAPQPGPEPEAVYYHTVAADQSGRTVAALVMSPERARREQVKAVMRYAGPRILWRHPVLSLRHWLDGFRKAPAVEPP